MRKVNYKIAYILAAVIVGVAFIFTSAMGSSFGSVAHAATSAYYYDDTDVLDDLQSSVLNGEKFDLEDYPHTDNHDPQIISFIEFCYSYSPKKQSDYGLYVYVYNPQDIAFDTDTDRNKIELSYIKDEYAKYNLQFLNYSAKSGYEGRFYKFKVILSAEQKSVILKSLNQNERIYEVIGIELSAKNVVTDYSCLQTYTYSGYALGYGSELATENTLTCKVDGVDKFLTLDVHSTYYRPKGFNGEGYTQDTLHSVYFAVPNKIVDSYGELTAVHATWLNALTNTVFVTGNSKVRDNILPYIGKEVDGGNFEKAKDDKSPVRYSLIASKFAASASWNNASKDFSFMSYNANSHYTNSDKTIKTLHYAFLAEGGDADKYTLPAETLIGNQVDGVKGYFQTYTEEHGGELVNSRYSKALFESVDDEFTDINIAADKTFKLTDQDVSLSWWDRVVGGGYHVNGTTEYEISAIKKVTDDDFKSTKSETCKDLYIDESDYKEFLDFFNSSKKKDETVYLFRYHQTPYSAYEVVEYKRGEGDWTIIQGTLFDYEYVDTNAYFMQMWVQLDFDIIDVTFTKDGVSTVIPVVMSPVDLAADATPPVITTDDDQIEWWKIILAILLLIILLVLLMPVLPYIFSGLWWLISAPFKALGKLFKKTGEKAKERKLRNAERRKEKRQEKERLKAERREEKRQEKERRRAERQETRRQEKERRKAECRAKRIERKIESKERKVKKKKLKSYENMSRDEIESYLDSIDWDDPIWMQINGSDE